MKSIHDLTDFVRNHMLEPTDIGDVLERLLADFDNLNAAHDAVLKAEKQAHQLKPIVELGQRYEVECAELLALRGDRDVLSAWFAAKASELWKERIAQLELEIAKRRDRRGHLDVQLARFNQQQTGLIIEMRAAGGERLEALQREMDGAAEERDHRRQNHEIYRALTTAVGLQMAANDHAFHANRQVAVGLLATMTEQKRKLDGQRVDRGIALREAKQVRETLQRDVEMLRNKRSNIDRAQLEMRSALCEVLQAEESRLPFVGELLEVRDGEQEWEGAIERVLRGFALSLLVPEDLYEQVAAYADRVRLSGRLVYYRVESETERRRLSELHPKSLVRKLNVKTDSEFYDWLQRELARYFDYACCGLNEFYREPKALTKTGQVKGGPRHEKDDRYAIDDRRRYVLGWRVEEKLRALLRLIREASESEAVAAKEVNQLSDQASGLETRRQAASDLLRIERYETIHWQAEARRIEDLKAEMEQLRTSSDLLRTLEQRLDELRSQTERAKQDYEAEIGQLSTAEDRKRNAADALRDAEKILTELSTATRQIHFARLDFSVPEWLGEAAFNVDRLAPQERQVREKLHGLIDNANGRMSAAASQLSARMQAFRSDWPVDATDFDAKPEALPEYSNLLHKLEADDLPRHRDRFRRLLRENTIQGVAMLQTRLEEQQQAIHDKIESINKSLHGIEYTPATYIRLQIDRDADTEIRDFNAEVRGILENTLGDDDPYSERRFLRVRALIERFRGRSEFLADDQRWRAKVLDVRAWFRFAASEHWRADNKQKEYYPDTGGKSGGQKEKLAYTVLAAGLAYQFGLDWGETRSRSFRFVVIDEAFGRGSEESTRYGLELFAKLNLQLLIVTPLQKINVIEDYIHSVAFTHKTIALEGERSAVRNLSIEEYRAEKARYFGTQGQ